MSVHSVLHPTSAERDMPSPTLAKNDDRKRAAETEGVKPNKKKKTAAR